MTSIRQRAAGVGRVDRVERIVGTSCTVTSANPASASNLCVNSAEKVFDQREEDGIVVLLTANPSTEHEEAVREAALGCPVLAITIAET